MTAALSGPAFGHTCRVFKNIRCPFQMGPSLESFFIDVQITVAYQLTNCEQLPSIILECLAWQTFFYFVKVSNSQKKYGVLYSSKKRRKLTILSNEGAQDSEFHLFF